MKPITALLALQPLFIATAWTTVVLPSKSSDELESDQKERGPDSSPTKITSPNTSSSPSLPNSLVQPQWSPSDVGVITDKFKRREGKDGKKKHGRVLENVDESELATKISNNPQIRSGGISSGKLGPMRVPSQVKAHKKVLKSAGGNELHSGSTARPALHGRIHDHEDDHNHMPPFVDMLPPGPFFDFERSGNITALVGQPAKLNCRVNQIGNRTVSWLRDRDTHLLTVGRYTYTSDQRFRAEHVTGSEDWPLTVKFAQVRDSGLYECQVSTTPPIRHYIWLNVVEPRTRVLGGPDVYINRGSSINLTCVVDYTPQPPLYVIWKHNNQVISYDSERGGVSVVTEKGPQTSTNLLIRNASSRDTGTYTCSPSSAPASSITVHILNGEHPAAMQHGGHSPQELSMALAGASLLLLIIGESLSVLTIM